MGLARRLASPLFAAAVTAFVSTVLIFGAVHLAPGDPIRILIGPKAVTPEVVEALTEKHGLDDPLWQQYLRWLGNVLHGDFGNSIQTNRPVLSMFGDVMPTTLFLLVYAFGLVVIFGIGFGIAAVRFPGRVSDGIVGLSSLFVALPTYVVGVVLVSVLSVQLGWFPVFGSGETLTERFWHLTLPAIALSLPYAAYITRISRASFLDEVKKEHVLTAQARGMSERSIMRRHIIRNGLLPVVSALGLILVSFLAGSILVERVFGLNGMGGVMLRAVNAKDFPVIQGGLLIIVLAFIVVNMAVDVINMTLDPRLRRGKQL